MQCVCVCLVCDITSHYTRVFRFPFCCCEQAPPSASVCNDGVWVDWGEAVLGEHDAPVEGYVLGWLMEGTTTTDDDENVLVGMKQRHLVTGLQPDSQYRFYVRAVNAVGSGPRGELGAVVRCARACCVCVCVLCVYVCVCPSCGVMCVRYLRASCDAVTRACVVICRCGRWARRPSQQSRRRCPA